MFFSKKYKETLLKIERTAVRIHMDLFKARVKIKLIIGLLEEIKALIQTLIQKPQPSTDPIDNLLVHARFGGISILFKLKEFQIMFTVADDHQDEPFSIDPVTGAADAEGNPIEATDFSISDPVSDNEAAVSIVDVEGGGKAVHFGAPGAAHVSASILYKGVEVKRLEASFLVTTGAIDPNSIVGGGISFPGLTPDA